ncbi:U4/U6 small nuclear ribonucleoprotein SNU13 [Nematocida sp. AWRm77]|nr:U4/U6 small nuclear ribonucleoprotein SNU13 [Nematocida sp. AWRm77]
MGRAHAQTDAAHTQTERKSKRKAEKDEKVEKSKKAEKSEKKPSTSKVNPKASPLCPDRITKKVYDLVAQAKRNKVLKIGVNEVIKKLNKGDAELIFIAGDAKPFAIVEPIVHLCENKNRTFYFVSSASSLGKACGLTRPGAACAIIYSENPLVKKLTGEIRDLMSNLE